MNFDESAEDAAFRREARAWLAANAPAFEPPFSDDRSEEMRLMRGWQARKAEGGYTAFGWPRELGGRGATQYQHLIFIAEESQYRLPVDIPHGGVDLVLPSLFRYAQPDQYQALTADTRTGRTVWAMLFSEPSAGSDITASRMSAVRDGEHWVLNGQKTWTSWSRYSDWAMTFARTDPTVPKQQGLSCFILDMRTPGVSVQPIRYMEGEVHGFDEVFFEDVCLPAAQLIGKPGEGFRIFLSTIAMDRFTASLHPEIGGTNFKPMLALAAQARGAQGRRLDESLVRQRFADYYVDIRGVENHRARQLTRLAHGQELGDDSAIGKLVLANRVQEMAAFTMDLLGPAGVVGKDLFAAELAQVHAGYFMGAGYRIGAGSDEIIRNVIGERVLGLPAEQRPDKDVPFNQLKAG